MWVEYLKSLVPEAKLVYSEQAKCPSANVESQTIVMPVGLPENIITIASIKHELAHLLFTEKTFDKGLTDNKLKDRNGLMDIANAIEDIRVEQKLGSQYVGINENFNELSQMVFDKMPSVDQSIRGFSMLTNCYLKSGELPKNADIDEDLKRFFDKNKMDIMEKYSTAKSVDDVMKMSDELCDKYEAEFGKIPPQPRGECSWGESGEGSGKGEKGESGGKEGGGEGVKGEEKGEAKGEEKGKTEGEEKGEATTSKGSSTKEGRGGEEKRPGSMQEAIRDLVRKRDKEKCYSTEYGNDGTDIVYEQDKLTKKFEHFSKQDMRGTDKAVLKLRQLLMNWFVSEERNRDLRLIQRGRISSRDLFRVMTEKKPRVFKKRILGKTNKVDLEILLDHSGSMNGYKIDKALELGYILNEALKNVKEVNYELIGFTTDGFDSYKYKGHGLDNVYYVYKAFGQKTDKKVSDLLKTSLDNGRRVLCHNNDYEALRYAHRRIATQPNTRKIIFVVSDGYPEVGFVSSKLLADKTKEEIRSLRKKGIEVYGFGINTDLSKIYDKGFIEIGCEDLHKVISGELIKLIKQGEKYDGKK